MKRYDRFLLGMVLAVVAWSVLSIDYHRAILQWAHASGYDVTVTPR
jgi:hypothetical protein